MYAVRLVDHFLAVQIPDLIDGLYGQLSAITNTQTRTGTLRCMRTITSQFLRPSLTHLLDKPLPWDEYVANFYDVALITLCLPWHLLLFVCSNMVAMWDVMTGDVQLMKNVFTHLLEVLSLTLPYQEKPRGSITVKVETPVPKAVSIGVTCTEEMVHCVFVVEWSFKQCLSLGHPSHCCPVP